MDLLHIIVKPVFSLLLCDNWVIYYNNSLAHMKSIMQCKTTVTMKYLQLLTAYLSNMLN